MKETNRIGFEHLDEEWVELIVMAKDIGISMEEIKQFLKKSAQPETSLQ